MTSQLRPYRRITAAEPAGGRRIRLTLDDGGVKTVDVTAALGGGVLARLAVDDDAFNAFYVDGGTVCWPGDLDLAPEYLNELPDIS